MVDNEALPEESWFDVAETASFFLYDDGLIVSTEMMYIQWEFDVIIGLSDWVILYTNVAKTVEIMCQPGLISGRQYVAAYDSNMTGEGESYIML